MSQPERWLALAVLAVVVLGWTVRSLVRTLRASVVASLPLSPEQTLDVPQAGAYDLYVEGTRFSTDFRGIEFEVFDAARTPVALRRAIFRTMVSGVRRVRLKLASFDAQAAGAHRLHLKGVRPGQDPANRIVVARPVTAKVIAHILALIALGALTMGAGGIALFAWLR